jgi:ubiquinone/menaquinone biosynthesis C-methylase UbiE
MLLEKYIAKQAGYPSGVFSGLVAALLNRTTSHINDVTIQLLDIKPTDHVLDIGFGGGATVQKIVRLAPNGLVAGIEISEAMLKRGKKKFGKLISQGKVDIREGSASKIPFESDCFDKVSTVNTIFFWPDPAAGMEEIIRVMKPKGRFVLTYSKKLPFNFTRYGFNLYQEEQTRDMLGKAGFTDIQVKTVEHPRFPTAFIVASKR